MHTGVRDPVTKQMFPNMEALERARKKREASPAIPIKEAVVIKSKKAKKKYSKPKPNKFKEVKANGNS